MTVHAHRAKRIPLAVPLIVVALALAALIAPACSGGDAGRAMKVMAPAALSLARGASEPQSRSTLSREHAVTIEVRESNLDAAYQRLSQRCLAEAARHCTIMQSDLASGDFPSGHIRLRIDPGAVEELIAFAVSQGRLERRSSNVEDLADAIADTQSRIEMLTAYRKQLLELQSKAATNVDAAIKIASALSSVQTDLERANGEAAYQTKRTTTDIVNIDFLVTQRSAFWRPVQQALRDFLANVSTGASQAITSVAYILPWLLLIVPGLYVARALWRRRRR